MAEPTWAESSIFGPSSLEAAHPAPTESPSTPGAAPTSVVAAPPTRLIAAPVLASAVTAANDHCAVAHTPAVEADIRRDRSGYIEAMGSGDRLQSEGDLPAAQAHFEEALRLASENLKDAPEDSERRADLAVALRRAGDVYGARGHGDRAKAAHALSRTLLRTPVSDAAVGQDGA
jgi:Flp pilus assembly protein TadD